MRWHTVRAGDKVLTMALRRWDRFARLERSRRSLLLEAACWLLLARLILLLLPFRRIAARLGRMLPPSNPDNPSRGAERLDEEAELARNIGWAVSRAAANVPFRAVCLPQAIAARIMLERRGIESVLRLGTALPDRDHPRLRAHAWLDAAGQKITGHPVAAEFIEVARFV